MDLFKPVPQDLSTLTDEQLVEIASEYTSTFRAIEAKDADVLGDRTMLEILEAAKAAREAFNTITDEQTRRSEAVATFEAEMAALTADLPASEENEEIVEEEAVAEVEEPEALEAEVVVEETPEAVAASAGAMRRPLPQPRRHAPVVVPQAEPEIDPRLVPLVASAGLPDFGQGHELTEHELGVALARAIRASVAGTGESVVIARADYRDKIPAERKLSEGAQVENSRKMYAMVGEMERNGAAALVADAGQGNCAPLQPYYQFQNISVQDRPVRDSLVGFTADRGGITWVPPTTLADIQDSGAVGVISEADQAAGGTFATKTCAVITCSEIQSQQVDQIYKCLQFGNLQSRAFPELVSLDNNLAMAAHARLAETLLLDSIKAGSVAVTGIDTATQGAINNYLGDLIQAAAGIRSVNRMSDEAPLQAIAPTWVKDLLVLDLVRSQFMRFEMAEAQIQAWLARYNILMTWTLDGPSDGTQVFGTQSTGALNPFPDTVETAIFPAGTWLFLDAGTLDLGIVRDSVLNQINAYQLFAETFEHAAKVGVVSYWLTSTLCPSGAVTIPVTGPTC